jgi:hypothetical protein
MNLATRIEAACRAHVGRNDIEPIEARRWFAARLHVSERSVERWCDGSRQFRGPALACLEMLEASARCCPLRIRPTVAILLFR